MNDRMIGIIATVDQNGLYQVGDQVPWGNTPGKTDLKYDNEHFHLITRQVVPAGKKNVIVAGYETAKSLAMHPFKDCRTIVLMNPVSLQRVNQGRSGDQVIYAEKTAEQALRRAIAWKDCGHVFFVGTGAGITSDILRLKLCNCAFVTIVKCDAFALSRIKDEPFYAKSLLEDSTFAGMRREITAEVEDMWETTPVELEFRNYKKA